MTIDTAIDGTQATMAIQGWLDTQTAPQLAKALDGLGEGVTSLTLDLKDLEYVSSAGIRQIVAAHKRLGGHMVLTNVREEVLEVLRLTGVAPRLNIS